MGPNNRIMMSVEEEDPDGRGTSIQHNNLIFASRENRLGSG